MLARLLITQACIPNTGSEVEEESIKELKQLRVRFCRKSGGKKPLEEQTHFASSHLLCREATISYIKGRLKNMISTASAGALWWDGVSWG